MKKILLLCLVFGITLLASASLFADDFEDCFNIERVKAKKEGATFSEALDHAEEICKIKFDKTKKTKTTTKKVEKNKDDSSLSTNSGAVTDSTDNTINFSIDIFIGNKNIEDLNIDLSTHGVLLDLNITPKFSFAASYFISTGEKKIVSTLDKTEPYEIQVSYLADETYDTQVPYYVDETYDATESYTYNDTAAGIITPPEVNFPTGDRFCWFFRDTNNDDTLNWDDDVCYGIGISSLSQTFDWAGGCANWYNVNGYGYYQSTYYYGVQFVADRNYLCFERGAYFSSPEDYNHDCYYSRYGGCLIYQYQDTYYTEIRTRDVILTRQIIGGYNTVTETRQVTRYRTETRTQQVAYNSTSIFNFEIQEFSLGGRFHLFQTKQNRLDIFLGGGAMQVSTTMETKTDTNPTSTNKGSGTGTYTEAGIKYVFKNGFNIGYYIRQSSAIFELYNNEDIPTEKREWGGTTTGVTLGYSF